MDGKKGTERKGKAGKHAETWQDGRQAGNSRESVERNIHGWDGIYVCMYVYIIDICVSVCVCIKSRYPNPAGFVDSYPRLPWQPRLTGPSTRCLFCTFGTPDQIQS